MLDWRTHKTALMILGGAIIGWFVATLPFSIIPDSADHWVWSRKLFLGYNEQPPLIALYIRLFSELIPNAELAIRISSFVNWGVSYWLLYFAAYKYFNSTRQAVYFLIILISAPYFFGTMYFVSISSVMFLFFSAYMLSVIYFLQDKGRETQLLIIGVLIGLGFMAKIMAVFYFVPLYGVILICPGYRYLFRSWQLYVGPLLALIVISPYIYYNYLNDWATIIYHYNRSLGSVSSFNFEAFVLYLLTPPIAYGILPALLIFKYFLTPAVYKTLLNSGDDVFWGLFFFIPFLFFAFNSMKGGQHDIQYINTSYVAGYFFLCKYLFNDVSAGNRRKILLSTLAVNITLIAFAYSHLIFKIFPINQSNLILNWTDTANQVSGLVRKNNQGKPAAFVITRKYDTAGALSLYMENQPFPYTTEKSKRNHWIEKNEIIDKNHAAAVVCETRYCDGIVEDSRALTQKNFRYVGTVETEHPFTKEVIRKFDVWLSNSITQ